MQSGASRVSVAFPPEQPGSVSVSATVPRRGCVTWPVIRPRPRLLLYVAEPDTDPGCSCAARGWDAAASFTGAGAPWCSPISKQRSVPLRSRVARTDAPPARDFPASFIEAPTVVPARPRIGPGPCPARRHKDTVLDVKQKWGARVQDRRVCPSAGRHRRWRAACACKLPQSPYQACSAPSV